MFCSGQGVFGLKARLNYCKIRQEGEKIGKLLFLSQQNCSTDWEALFWEVDKFVSSKKNSNFLPDLQKNPSTFLKIFRSLILSKIGGDEYKLISNGLDLFLMFVAYFCLISFPWYV